MFSEPSQVVEALIKGRRVHHDGHRVLRWNWENIAIKTDDAGRIRPVKPRNPAKRIDGAVALIMGERAHAAPRDRVPEYQIVVVGGA
jgi:phage terminase large subunit-like protein